MRFKLEFICDTVAFGTTDKERDQAVAGILDFVKTHLPDTSQFRLGVSLPLYDADGRRIGFAHFDDAPVVYR